jgi:uncharacterized delta-60 repeat protein
VIKMIIRVIHKLSIGLILLYLFIPSASAQFINEQWVARYNSSGSNYDVAHALAVDANGNVYVTGESEGNGTHHDYYTIKYDASGNEKWAARYNGPDIYNDTANALAVDSDENVYVTGSSDGDCATIKYDAAGNELWVARYNGPGSSYDEAYALTVDSDGNVYVTGSSDGDYATIKYDASGNELWVARYNGPGNSSDRTYALAVDSDGNVYVTGSSVNSRIESEYATIKYDASGNELWVASYNGPGDGTASSSDEAHALAVDAHGNVYVTGGSYGSDTGYDYATVKYDASGNEVWVARYNGQGSGSSYDVAYAMAVDADGNIYVTGGSDSAYVTIKYDTSGSEQWLVRYSGPISSDTAYALALDAEGSVYVAGRSRGSGTDYDYATIKYDASGNEKWVARYNRSRLGYNYDVAHALAVDVDGNVYVTGESWDDGTSSDYATIKYRQYAEQVEVLIDIMPGSYPNNINLKSEGEVPVAILTTDDFDAAKVDPTSCVFGGASPVSWHMEDVDNDVDRDMLMLWEIRKLDLASASTEARLLGETYDGRQITGTDSVNIIPDEKSNGYDEQWVARYNGPDSASDRPSALAVDADGNVYVTGTSAGSGDDNSDIATIKYDASGNELWVIRYNGPGSSYNGANALAVDADGNVYVTGYSLTGVENYDYVTIKYDPAGNELWVARYDGPISNIDYAIALVVDVDGNVYVTGNSQSDTDLDYATIKYDASGKELWVARYNGPADTYDSVRALAVDAAGNVYVTGEIYISIEPVNSDYATIKYDASGNELWVARYNGPAGMADGASALAVDADGNVYVIGYSNNGSGDDNAIVKYDASGNELWVIYNKGSDLGTLVVDPDGNVYVTGHRENGSANSDSVLIKYDASGKELWAAYCRYGAADLSVDVDGNVYATGYTAKIKYDALGNEQWVALYSRPNSSGIEARALAVDADGNVYVTGSSFGDYITVKYHQYAVQVEVLIDIMPGSYPNNINLKSEGKVPVAILTTDDFDAAKVDPTSCVFGGASPVSWHMEDVDNDGDLDVVMLWEIRKLDLASDSTEARLLGETYDGRQITGTDSVNIVPDEKSDGQENIVKQKGGGGGCFISSSAYGIRMAREILTVFFIFGSSIIVSLALRQRLRK